MHPDGHAVAVAGFPYLRIVGVVNPIDARADEHRHAVFGRSAGLQMLHSLLERVEDKGVLGCFGIGQRAIHQQALGAESGGGGGFGGATVGHLTDGVG